MRRITFTSLLVLFIFAMSLTLQAQAPSPVLWFQQDSFSFDSTTAVYTIVLEWQEGIVDEEHPQAEGFYVYRSMVGHDEAIEDYELVATVSSDDIIDDKYLLEDEVVFEGVFYYYVKAYKGANESEMSPRIMAFSLGNYCVNLNAEIIDFKSHPNTIAIPGEQYEYQAYAKHRSMRVQGWVRYKILEGPEGLTVDEKEGLVQWNTPPNASGDYYVKLQATSLETPGAESIQEWYIRTASEEEIASLTTSVVESHLNEIKVYPNPANDYIQIKFTALNNTAKLSLLSLTGKIVYSKTINNSSDSHLIPVSQLSAGVYFLKIEDGNNSFSKTVVKD